MKAYLPIIIAGLIAMTVFTLLWRRGAFLRLSGYFRETQDELKKCTWPSWDELNGSTVVVIVSVALLGGYTVGVDFLVANVVRVLFHFH
jgi:preprotein translocase subunit SecE